MCLFVLPGTGDSKTAVFPRGICVKRSLHPGRQWLGTPIAVVTSMDAIIKKLTVAMLVVLGLAASPARAIPVNITMLGDHSVSAVPKSALGNFGDSTVLNWLQNDVTAYNTAFSTSYSTPIANLDGSPLSKVETYFGPRSVTLTVASDRL